MEGIRRQLGYEGMIVVEPQCRSGGLTLLWREENQGNLLSFSQNHIDIEINVDGMRPWRLTRFYGEPDRAKRRKTWDLLRHLARDSNLPWCVIGDLNNVCSQLDKKGGALYPSWLVEGFNETLADTGLIDMELVGHQYTWERGTENWQEIRLDRALTTEEWLCLFPLAKLYNLEGSESDHSPLLLLPKPSEQKKGITKFRFENAWLLEPMCTQLVKETWNEYLGYNIQEKVAMCGEKLLYWGKQITGDFAKRIKACNLDLKLLRSKRDDRLVERYKEVKAKLYLILEQREIFWRQRSKQLWLQSGDQNSKYFHASANTRRRTNRIHKLKNEAGEWKEWDSGLAGLITDYYTELFSSTQADWAEVVDCVPSSITAEQNNKLLQEITEVEVKHALFQMHPDKAPGPDGMTPAFFQKHWQVVGGDVVNMVREFVHTGMIRCGLNVTNVVLIPKKKCPTTISELRPISLCNVLAKIITKVLANRMKELLEAVISENQSAFIPGRLISDNMMVSYEAMHYLKRKRRGKGGFMALKLDMSKAYDRVEWPFLQAILMKMGFHERWVNLIMQCVSSVSHTITHGQYEMGPIIPTRGIRQGDPLSPYLFIICAEGLFALIRKYETRKLMTRIKVCNQAPSITHMFFADDSYLFCKAEVEEANRVLSLLHTFEKASGQKVNSAKSSIFFSSNINTTSRTDICSVLGMKEADERSTYLGLPNTLGRNKSSILGFLKDKITKRVESWDGKLIAKSGREVLIKSVAQSIPSYAMSVFLLPLSITRDIERILAKYWWRSKSSESKGIHWMSWDRLSRHKSTGGMGFRDFRDFNLALLGKQGWRFLTKPDSLVSQLYKARYFPSGNFLNASLGRNPSFVWRSVWEAQNIIQKGVRWEVGSGDKIDILDQPWLNDTHNPYVITVSETLSNAKVSSLLIVDRSDWDADILNDLFNTRDQECIRRTPRLGNSDEDKLYWGEEASGLYSVKSAYRLLQSQKGLWNTTDNDSVWKKMWRLKAPPKVLNLLWRAMSFCLPTNIMLQQKHVPVAATCPVCEGEVETIIHALVRCPFAMQCWQVSFPDVLNYLVEDFNAWFVQVLSYSSPSRCAEITMLCWTIWKARNDKVWRSIKSRVNCVVSSAMQYLLQWKNAQSKFFSPVTHSFQEGDGAILWVKPQGDVIKVSVDAACFNEFSAFGVGMVARSSDGDLIQACSKVFQGNAAPELAEVVAIKEALSWMKTKQWSKVEFESDCLVAVHAIRSQVAMRSPFGREVESCRRMIKELKTTSLSFIKRSANKAAHFIARESYSFSDRVLDRGNTPIEFLNILQADLAF